MFEIFGDKPVLLDTRDKGRSRKGIRRIRLRPWRKLHLARRGTCQVYDERFAFVEVEGFNLSVDVMVEIV